jgi:tetratricopeptide (TPR) repeat protein
MLEQREEEINRLVSEAKSNFKEGKLSEAFALFKKALEIDPENENIQNAYEKIKKILIDKQLKQLDESLK